MDLPWKRRLPLSGQPKQKMRRPFEERKSSWTHFGLKEAGQRRPEQEQERRRNNGSSVVHPRSIRRRDWGNIHFEFVYGEWPAPVIAKEETVRGDIEKLKGFLNSIRKQQADYLSLQEELRRLEFEAHNLRGVQMGEKCRAAIVPTWRKSWKN